MKTIFKGRFRVTSGFRLSNRLNHHGIDLVGDDDKTVYCPVDGVVKSSTMVPRSSGDVTWEWGNYVRVDDSAGNRLFFCHLLSRAVVVGQKVKVGDKLGVMGNTGLSSGAHTHFEVRKKDGVTRLDPAKYLGIPNRIGSYCLPGWVRKNGKLYFYKSDGALLLTDSKGVVK